MKNSQKELVLIRLKTLNPESKISFGSSDSELSVKEIIEHVEKEDSFGKKIVSAQLNAIKIMAGI